MKYIEETEDSIRVYEVKIDEKRIRELIFLLDRDCYIRRFGICYTTSDSYNEDDATENIKNMDNNASLNINEHFEVKDIYEGPYWYHGEPLDVDYEAIYRDSVLLVNYLESLLVNPPSNCTIEVNNIINYNQSIDFVPFLERVKFAEENFDRQQGKDSRQVIKLLKKYENALIEAKLNENYNYERLYELYQEVLKCFTFALVEERKNYKLGKPCDLIKKIKNN